MSDETITEKIKANIDYCSGVPDFLYMKPCCKEHDKDYANQVGKFKADWTFYKCGLYNAEGQKTLLKRVKTRTIATVYFIGVSLFGWVPYWRCR